MGCRNLNSREGSKMKVNEIENYGNKEMEVLLGVEDEMVE